MGTGLGADEDAKERGASVDDDAERLRGRADKELREELVAVGVREPELLGALGDLSRDAACPISTG